MSNNIQIKVKEAGFVYESSYGDDPILIGSEVIKYMRYMGSFGPFPDYEPETVVYHLPNASREPNEFRLALKKCDFGITGQPTNLIPFYLFFGKSTSVGTDHTIEAQDPDVEKPSLAHRYKYESDQIDQIKHVLGNKCISLTLDYDLITTKIPQIVLLFTGREIVDPGFVGENAPVLPGTNTLYDKKIDARWDSTDPTSGGEDIKGALATFSLQCIDTAVFEGPELDQILINRVIDGSFTYIVRLAMKRGSTLSITDYLLDFTNDTTLKNMAVRLYASDTKYIDLVLSGLFPKKRTEKENIPRDAEHDVYEMWVKSVVPSGDDGLSASTYYGE
jgi:hypothetical protein